MTTTTAGSQAAVDRLRRAAELRQALAPLRRILADAEEEMRAAALVAAEAGMSERAIATQLDVSQPTVHSWLDERRAAPMPPPSTAAQTWALHHVAATARSLVGRLLGEPTIPASAPTPSHLGPREALGRACNLLDSAANFLASAAAAIDFTNATR